MDEVKSIEVIRVELLSLYCWRSARSLKLMLHYHANDLVGPRFQGNIKRIKHLKECETSVRRVSVLDDPCDKED